MKLKKYLIIRKAKILLFKVFKAEEELKYAKWKLEQADMEYQAYIYKNKDQLNSQTKQDEGESK